ncbi:MFS transporter [uncultured Bilophila sp.]|uniref:MFS transporter n=1 Tax=uncultured Bilophila sp. TaxID=529385 RepID=UPI0026DCB067|nr:MFS transporter [uncultured Bilophila sp.]
MTTDSPKHAGGHDGQPFRSVRPVGPAGLALVLCVALIGVMGVSITLPILPKLAGVFRLDASGVALLITCFTLPSAFMTPIAGVLADRFGRKAVLLPGLVLFACGGVGCALSKSFGMLLACRAVQGLGAAPLGILYGTLVGDMYEESERPKMMGMIGATISLGTALYPGVGGLLGEMDWRWPFWVSLFALPVALLALRVPLERPHADMDWARYARESKAIILRPAALGLFALTFLCFCILYGPTITYFPLLADLLYNASPSHIGGVFTLASLGTALIAMNLAWLGKKHSHRRLLLAATGCYLLAQGLMLALPGVAPSLWWLTLPIFLGGAAQGLTFPLLNARMTTLAPTRNRAIVMAMNGTVLRLSQSLSPLVFGIGWSVIGWRGPYAMGIGVSLLIGALVLYVYPTSSGKE